MKAEWGGPVADVAQTVMVDGDLKFKPTGVPRRGALNNVPVTGEAVAHYDGKREVVDIQRVLLQTPQSTTQAAGIVGVNQGDPLTNLKVDTTVRDLGEFDQLLQTLGFEANGKKGTAAIPVVLHGGLIFHGTATGRAADLDVKGHLTGSQLEVKLGTELDTLIDSAVMDAEYSYDSGLAVASSTIKRGTAVLNLAGALKPRKVVKRHGVTDYLWDEGTAVDATVQLANANVVDVLQIAGQQNKLPLTGTIGVNAKLVGTFANLNGDGHVSLTNGVAYGEPYDSAAVNLAVKGQDIEASQVALVMHGAKITGNGGYDMQTKHVHGHIQGNNLVLSKFQTVAKANPNADGTLTLVADANGTMDAPGVKATAKLANVSVAGKGIGSMTADVHSEGSLLHVYSAVDPGGREDRRSGADAVDGRLRHAGEADACRTGYRQGDDAVQHHDDQSAVIDRRYGDGEWTAEDSERTEWHRGAQRLRCEAAGHRAEERRAAARQPEKWPCNA